MELSSGIEKCQRTKDKVIGVFSAPDVMLPRRNARCRYRHEGRFPSALLLLLVLLGVEVMQVVADQFIPTMNIVL